MRRKKEKSPVRQDRGNYQNLLQEDNNIPKRLVNPETGEIFPVIPLPPPGYRTETKKINDTKEEFYQMYAKGWPEGFEHRASAAANSVLRWMEQHLGWGHNMIEADDGFATYDTIRQAYGSEGRLKSLEWACRTVAELEREGFVIRVKCTNRKTYFFLSPFYLYRGHRQTRDIVMAAWKSLLGQKTEATFAQVQEMSERVSQVEEQIKGKVIYLRKRAGL